MSGSREQIVEANGVELCAETFGDAADPPILLVMGSSASMDWWEDELCERLAAGERFVIRYDHRDTGRSVSYEPGAPEYGFHDLVDDAVGLLDHFGIAQAHLVGMSMGGGIVQVMALEHPDRVASLTLISAGPASPAADAPDLPGMSEETAAAFGVDAPDWSDRSAVADYMVHLARVSGGSLPFDEPAFRELVGRTFDRTTDFGSSMTNHNVMKVDELREELRGRAPAAPALVIHGTEDPVVPYENGVALAETIPGAELVTLEGMGHELPRPVWGTVVPAIVTHTD